jgi:hypothetical protein
MLQAAAHRENRSCAWAQQLPEACAAERNQTTIARAMAGKSDMIAARPEGRRQARDPRCASRPRAAPPRCRATTRHQTRCPRSCTCCPPAAAARPNLKSLDRRSLQQRCNSPSSIGAVERTWGRLQAQKATRGRRTWNRRTKCQYMS